MTTRHENSAPRIDVAGRSPNGTTYFGGVLDEVRVRRDAAGSAEVVLMILDPTGRRHVDDDVRGRLLRHAEGYLRAQS